MLSGSVAVLGICSAAAVGAPMLAGNPLAGLPTPPGATVDAIEALENNGWLNLGSPAADPTWGNAYGRSWGGSAMVLASDLRGAMYTGEGVHAFVKPDGFGMDDWWFYDINSHAWICVFPGTDTQNFNDQVAGGEIVVDAQGRAVDVDGQPVPGHLAIHSYHWLTYDSARREFVLFPSWGQFGTYFMPGGAAVDAGIAALEGQGKGDRTDPLGPWTYDPQIGKFAWEVAVNNPPFGYDVNGFPFFQYIDSTGQYFLAQGEGSAFFDPSTRTWSSTGPSSLSSYDFSGCYDSLNDRVYVGGGPNNFFSVDIETGDWTSITFPSPPANGFSTNSGAVTYDAHNDRVLVWVFGDTDAIYPLDPSTDTFADPIPFDSAFASSLRQTHSVFFDSVLGVHFIFTAGDSRDNGLMWVFKYRVFNDGVAPGPPTNLQAQ